MSSAVKRSDTKNKGFFGTLRKGIRKAGDVVNSEFDIELKVHIAQDEETCVWFIAASDVPGLRVEGDTADELIRKVEDIAPELIELNMAEIIAAANAKQKRRRKSVAMPAAEAAVGRKPRTLILPVFDSPLAFAC